MLVAVDCAQESRIVEQALVEAARLTVNIDHHHDNTRFGDIDLVVDDASSTAEVLADVFVALGIELNHAIAEALYTAVVTDTGRFQYSNTTPKALRLAAELVEAGADVSKVFVEVYESTPFPKLKLNTAVKDLLEFRYEDFTLEGYDPHPAIKAPIAV